MNNIPAAANKDKLIEPFVVPKSMSLLALLAECSKVGAVTRDGDGKAVLYYRFTDGVDYVLHTRRIDVERITRFYASVDELHAANDATLFERGDRK